MIYNSRHGVVPLSAALIAALGAFSAHAESNFHSNTGTLNATARLDFRITVPKFLFLQVGTGTLVANNNAVDLIDFVVPAASVGNGSAIAATPASGDLGNGTVSARVLANDGAVTLTSQTAGALTNAAGDTIPFSEVVTTSNTWLSSTPLAHPTLATGATSTVNVPAAGKIVNRDARWTFSYANSTAVPPGVYGGVNTGNSRVTYTAMLP